MKNYPNMVPSLLEVIKAFTWRSIPFLAKIASDVEVLEARQGKSHKRPDKNENYVEISYGYIDLKFEH